jgi:hypothetical protein
MQVAHDETSDDLLGEFSHMTLAEGCFWLSVTNLVTIGYGGIVSVSSLVAHRSLMCRFCSLHPHQLREAPSTVGLPAVSV